MTTTNTKPNAYHGTDPRPMFFAGCDTVEELIATTSADQLDLPTPCAQFNVRQLLGHLVGVADRVAAVGRGEDPMGGQGDDPAAMAEEPLDVAGDDWVGAWRDAVAKARQAWVGDAPLSRTVVLPWVTQDGAECLRMWTNELVVHGWDLATATNRSVSFAEEVLRTSLDAIKQQLPLADRTPLWEAMRQQFGATAEEFPPPFDNAVPVPADASLLDQVVAWNGHRPA